MMLSLLLFSGITVLSVAVVEKKSSFATQKSVIAFQAADSGAERVLKRIYIDNSPAVASVPLGGTMPDDATLNALASDLDDVSGASCSSGRVTASNNANPAYSFEVTFYDDTGSAISCGNTEWRDEVIRIRSEGFYQRTSRVVEIGIRPRE